MLKSLSLNEEQLRLPPHQSVDLDGAGQPTAPFSKETALARNSRGRTLGADNIAVGLVSGTEKIAVGLLPPPEKVGGLDNVAVGSAFPTTIIADDQQVGVTTMLIERRG